MAFYFLLRSLPVEEADCLFLDSLHWCCSDGVTPLEGVYRQDTARMVLAGLTA